jgi:hypothetical protein
MGIAPFCNDHFNKTCHQYSITNEYLSLSPALLFGNLFNDSSQWPLFLCRQRHQRRICASQDIVLGKVLTQLVLLQIRMEFNLVHNRFMFRNLEDTFKIDNPEIRDADVLSKAFPLAQFRRPRTLISQFLKSRPNEFNVHVKGGVKKV